jgi:DNA mismatch repair protein MutS
MSPLVSFSLLKEALNTSEVLYERSTDKRFVEEFGNNFYTYRLEDWAFSDEFARETLHSHFGTTSLKGFGVEDMSAGIVAAGAAVHYLAETKHSETSHIQKISRIDNGQHVWLDRFTIRNLELVYSPHFDATTLLDVMDHTVSPMGARLMKRWIVLPQKNLETIRSRHEVVGRLMQSTDEAEQLSKDIRQVGDLERLAGKIAVGRVNPRELLQLKRALDSIKPIRAYCEKSKNAELKALAKRIDLRETLNENISSTLSEDPPVTINKGNVIADGINEELDALRKVAFSGKDYLLEIQQREMEATGIPSLKIAYNNVFGYYLEVRNAYKDKVPEEWIRKQTLTQAERYITEELKEYESQILGAEEKILALETRLFSELVLQCIEHIPALQSNAKAIAELDCLLSFAKIALRNGYTRPQMNEGFALKISEGRHPVIEQNLPVGEAYVANDIFLDKETQQIMMITGPNMSGKSALLRQTALIVLMAQMGSYVPAKSADIGLVDRIFTRVGASDNISGGESTFMVEMNETASILNNLSDRSLILLDEIGRGTSTYDGISIAWSIAEYLHEHDHFKGKTLFATHYHELNEMSTSFSRIKNFNVSVKEVHKKIIFLRKLVAGGSNHSFGIHVAKMAGMPTKVVQRANDVLKQLEKDHGSELSPHVEAIQSDMQLSFFKLDDPVLEQIKEEIIKTDINTLTPVEALLKLNEIKKMVGG